MFFRRPLFPIVILLLLLACACLTAYFSYIVLSNKTAIEDMYNSFLLTFQVLPGAGTDGVLRMPEKNALLIRSVKGVEKDFYYLQCPFSLREPLVTEEFSTVYGTNSIDFFIKNREIEIIYGEDVSEWASPAFTEASQDNRCPCIIDSVLSDRLNVRRGDTISISGCDVNNDDAVSAPSIELSIEGVFVNNSGLLDANSIIVPSYLFEGTQGLLFNSRML